jgi:SAM-dependent methyltransferase
MPARAVDSVVAFYERTLDRHGPGSARGVRWPSDELQRRLFEGLMAAGGPWPGASVADVGCGVGDLYAHLQEQGLEVKYWGCDLAPAMVAAARRKHPQARARFVVRDILERGLPRRFDFVVASGTFNIRVEDHEAHVRRLVTAMYEGCRRAVVFNVLVPRPPGDLEGEYLEHLGYYYLADLPALEAFCRRLAPRVASRVDDETGHATVFLHR